MADLLSQILEEQAKQVAKNIDNHILFDVMISSGWQEFPVDPWKHNSEKKIRNWCKNNCLGEWMQAGNRWAFENKEDHLIFALVWS